MRFCNVGYGRDGCLRFPHDANADAVRFHIANEKVELIRIQYVYEKDCWPREHGTLECSLKSLGPCASQANELLLRQAGAFLESFQRRSAP